MRLSVTPNRCGEAWMLVGFSSEGAARSDRGDIGAVGAGITRWWIRRGGKWGRGG